MALCRVASKGGIFSNRTFDPSANTIIHLLPYVKFVCAKTEKKNDIAIGTFHLYCFRRRFSGRDNTAVSIISTAGNRRIVVHSLSWGGRKWRRN